MEVLDIIRKHLDTDFAPTRALDFGCGVGRLTLPLARRCDTVVGVDISAAMLAETWANAREAGLDNVELATSDDTLGAPAGTFDLIHSFIVFQHMPCNRGQIVARKMVERLRHGGVGVLHFTYGYSATMPPPTARRALTEGYARVPALNAVRNMAKGLPLRSPPMEMNLYDLNKLFVLLQGSGCQDLHVRFTETSHFGYPVYGVVLYFSKTNPA